MPIPKMPGELRGMLMIALHSHEVRPLGELVDVVMRVLAQYDLCFVKAAEAGEPTFTLRAQDVTAAGAVFDWIQRNPQLSMPRRAEALECAGRMRAWSNRKPPD